MAQPVRVLFVCLGNICRSPTAHAVFAQKAALAGLEKQVQVRSAGTNSGHIGWPPDERAQVHANKRGYDLSALRATALTTELCEWADLILAMDKSNERDALAFCPDGHGHKVKLFTHYLSPPSHQGVPDPYYGGSDGFERVLDLIEEACDGLVRELFHPALKPKT